MTEVLDKIEGAFTGLGLAQSPLMRGAFGFVVGSVVAEALRPQISYRGDERRPWAVVSNDKDATLFPWWTYGVGTGMLFGMFI
jgi:hypothetical protein